jgi:hypothetical protein
LLVVVALLSLIMSAFPDYLVQEIRSLIAVLCRNKVMIGKSGDGETVGGQELLIEKMFHGSEGYASHVDLFMSGKGAFEMAFIKSELENNREGNEVRPEGFMLELRSVLHCDLSARYVVGENGFDAKTISINSKGNKPLEGRNLNEKALLVIATLKHVYLFHKEFVDANGQNPSGTKLEDMLLYVRQKCYVLFKGKKNMALCKKSKPTGEFTEEDMPVKYFFTGFFAFLLFGPQGISGSSLECLSTDGKNAPKKSRAQARKEDLDVRNKEREASVGGYVPEDYRRGVNIRDKVSCAHIAQAEMKEARQNVRELLLICNDDHRNTLQEIDLIGRMIERGEDNGVDTSEFGQRMLELMGALKSIQQRKESLRNESDKLMKEGSKRQIEALYEQVGSFEKRQKVIDVDEDRSVAVQSELSSSEPPTPHSTKTY